MKPEHKYLFLTTMNKMKQFSLFVFFLTFIAAFNASAQNNLPNSTLKSIMIFVDMNTFYTFSYKDIKPDDVPQEAYDGLWEIQKEIIDNFTYDYDVYYGRRRAAIMTTIEDYYRHGKGVCENYSDFFILLARQRGLTENLYKVSGD
jgi:hypothetical protein